MKALILWADAQSPNLGVRVLAKGAQEVLSQAYPGIEVTTLSNSRVQVSGRSLIRALVDSRSPVSRLFSDSDIVYDTGGGDSLTDIYGIKRLVLMGIAHNLIRRSGAKLIVGPQTIGPFDHRLSKKIGRHMLRRADRVFARDALSALYAESIGASVDGVGTDVVFALPLAESAVEQKDRIIVNVSGLLWDPNPHVEFSKYRSNVRLLVSTLLTRGESVGLLAHVLASPSPDNDERIFEDLSGEFGSNVSYLVPNGLESVRSELTSAKVVVGARMHACLNALSVGTPAIAWAYSRKFRPLLEDLGWNHIVDLRSDEDVVPLTLRLLDRPELLAEDLERLKRRSSLRIDETVDLLRSEIFT